jgi:hypothetical protein
VAVEMRCCHLKYKGEIWRLDLGGEGTTIRDAAGNARSEFKPEEAAAVFRLPSFSESIKQFRPPVDGEEWYFDVGKDGLKEIRAFMDAAVVAAGPEALQAMRSSAIRELLLGAVLAVAGVVMSIGSFMAAANNPQGGQYYVTYGLVIAGLVVNGRGGYQLARYKRLKRVAGQR